MKPLELVCYSPLLAFIHFRYPVVGDVCEYNHKHYGTTDQASTIAAADALVRYCSGSTGTGINLSLGCSVVLPSGVDAVMCCIFCML